jgi:NhaP-type Na+/H+ or K+/H+ antiporter
MEPIITLINILVLIVIAYAGSYISKKLSIPKSLILVLSGLGLGALTYGEEKMFQLPDAILYIFFVLAIVLAVFDRTSRFNFRKYDTLKGLSLRFSLVQLVGSVLILGAGAAYLLSIKDYFFGAILAILTIGHGPTVLLSKIHKKSKKIAHFLENELFYSSVIVTVSVFTLMKILLLITENETFDFIVDFGIPFISTIGLGMIVGLIMVRYMKKYFSKKVSPLLLLFGLLLCFVTAENMNGIGVIAVIVFSLIFGNTNILEKKKLSGPAGTLNEMLSSASFVLVGALIGLAWEPEFFLFGALLYLGFIIVRLLAVAASHTKEDFTIREMMLISLKCPKGNLVAATILGLYIISQGFILDANYADQKIMLWTSVLFILISAAISSIAAHSHNFFLGEGK